MAAPVPLRDLRAHAVRLANRPIGVLNAGCPDRARELALRVGPIYANFARQRYDDAAVDALFALADAANFPARLKSLFDGVDVNVTERRPALHTALRSNLSTADVARAAHAQAVAARQRMAELVTELAASDITDIISVGIGGSDLGPRLVVDALADPANARFRVHFVSNVDPAAVERVMAELDPARVAVLLISKSFGTQETLLNGAILRDWLGAGAARRLFAITANGDRASAQFAIAPDRILPMWDWVGGRYSLWSAVGFPIALALGFERFEELLAGAAEMDEHVLTAPPRENLAAWHALTSVWNRNGLGFATQAVLPYSERLRLLPAFLQQLVMESLGKSVRTDGVPVDEPTVPVWWGGIGTDSQHSFFQALHQGSQVVPMDLIGIVEDVGRERSAAGRSMRGNRHALIANLLAQAEGLANGQASEDPHRSYPGNRPSTMFLLDRLDARTLGALLAMYEHSVYLQAVVWGINPFDQFGVELGKQIAGDLLPALEDKAPVSDPVTRVLLEVLHSKY